MSRAATSRKLRTHADGASKQQLLRRMADITLGTGSLKEAVKLPPNENENEWLAAHVEDFYNHVNLLYGIVTEHCTPQECRVMSAGPKYEYYWSDGVKYKKATKLTAPEYVDELMTWVQKQLDDEAVFPTHPGEPFPKDFRKTVKTICRRLFRVYAHIYLHHHRIVEILNSQAHLNTSFKHFVYFITTFNLVDKKELEPLMDLIVLLTAEKIN